MSRATINIAVSVRSIGRMGVSMGLDGEKHL